MGVYIKGMKMPTRCWDCLLNTYGYCMASEHSDIIPSNAPIPNWCPLVPVPPHGRLIDADALMELYADTDDLRLENMKVPIAVIRQNIMDAPTIIEGEES